MRPPGRHCNATPAVITVKSPVPKNFPVTLDTLVWPWVWPEVWPEM